MKKDEDTNKGQQSRHGKEDRDKRRTKDKEHEKDKTVENKANEGKQNEMTGTTERGCDRATNKRGDNRNDRAPKEETEEIKNRRDDTPITKADRQKKQETETDKIPDDDWITHYGDRREKERR